MNKEELIKFRKSFDSVYGSRNVLKDSSTCESIFHNLAHITEWSDTIFMKIIMRNATLNSEVPIKFWWSAGSEVRIGSPDSLRTPDPDQILLGGGMRSVTALVILADLVLFITPSNLSFVMVFRTDNGSVSRWIT